MARLTLKRLRDNVDANDIGKAGLANDQHLKRKILNRELQATGNPALALVLSQQSKLEARHSRAKQRAAPDGPLAPKDGPPRRKDFGSPAGFNRCGADVGRSYVSRAAEGKEAKQAGFPNVMRHPSTIDLVILPLNADLKVHTDRVRPRIRDALQELTHGSQTEGSFQVSLHEAWYLSKIIPECEWPAGFEPMVRPYEVFALLHWHGVICDPYLSKAAIRKQIDQAFPGCRRVCIRRVMPEKTDKSGRTTHGAQGFHEYSLMNKTEIKFTGTKQKIDAVIGHAQLAATWTKRNRRFSMGRPLSVTGVEIDPERVGQLKLMEKLHDVRKNWSKLDYAQQFIHLWMSGAIRLVRKPQDWLRLHGTIASRIKQMMQLVNNWFETDRAQDIEFIDYVVSSRE